MAGYDSLAKIDESDVLWEIILPYNELGYDERAKNWWRLHACERLLHRALVEVNKVTFPWDFVFLKIENWWGSFAHTVVFSTISKHTCSWENYGNYLFRAFNGNKRWRLLMNKFLVRFMKFCIIDWSSNSKSHHLKKKIVWRMRSWS